MWLRNWDNILIAGAGADKYADSSSDFKSIYRGGSSINMTTSRTSGSNFADDSLDIKATNGSVYRFALGLSQLHPSTSMYCIAPGCLKAYGSSGSTANYPCSLVIGDGTTSVRYDDYKLSGTGYATANITSYVQNEPVYNATTHTFSKTCKLTYNNSTGSSDVVIREWGLIVYTDYVNSYTGAYSATAGTNSSYTCLVFREVLDNPITIPAGTFGDIEITLEFPRANWSAS